MLVAGLVYAALLSRFGEHSLSTVSAPVLPGVLRV